MPRWLRRSARPTDDQTALAMRTLAEAFAGDEFTWESTEATRLDGVCDLFMAAAPAEEEFEALVAGLGAYLGELLVRHAGGRWTYDPEQKMAAVELPTGFRGFPHHKVAKRLELGPEHDLFEFYWYAITNDVPPGSIVTQWGSSRDL